MSDSGLSDKKSIRLIDDVDATEQIKKNHKRVVRSGLHILPYEAAQLAAFAPPLQRSRPSGKFVSICVAFVLATASVATASWRSTTSDEDKKQQIDAGFNREELDNPALRDESAAPRTELSLKSKATPSTITTAFSKSPNDEGSPASANDMLTNDQDAETAHLKDRSRTRAQHKPKFKPLDVAALLPPAAVTTLFRPAFKPTETALSNSTDPEPIASSNAIDHAEQTPTFKRLWTKVAHGVVEAFRNRDTTYQMASRADADNRGSDEDRNDSGNNDDDDH